MSGYCLIHKITILIHFRIPASGHSIVVNASASECESLLGARSLPERCGGNRFQFITVSNCVLTRTVLWEGNTSDQMDGCQRHLSTSLKAKQQQKRKSPSLKNSPPEDTGSEDLKRALACYTVLNTTRLL